MKVRSVSVSQLREPVHAARTSIDDAALAELAASIRALGVLLPLRVLAGDDGTFEVVAGHRRLLAARIAGLAAVPCVVEEDGAAADAVKLHENLMREELTPADEAVFLAELYDKHGEDVDRVAGLVKRPREYVERRLSLLRGDPAVFKALQEGTVSVGVAEELNRMVRQSDRAYHLDYAARTGCTVRQAREWRAAANLRAEQEASAPSPPASGTSQDGAPAAPAPPVPHYAAFARPDEFSASRELRECLFCAKQGQEWQMFRKHVCQGCADTHLVPLERRRNG